LQSAFDEENKKKAVLSKELERIRIELNQSNEEKHKCQAQINLLMEENNRFRDFSGKSESEIESMASRAKALEVCASVTGSSFGSSFKFGIEFSIIVKSVSGKL
jgi:kinesin family protein C1